VTALLNSPVMASFDGPYYLLKPTLSHDNGPNCKDKIYNGVGLKYMGQEEMVAVARCVVDVPVAEGQGKEWSMPVKFIVK